MNRTRSSASRALAVPFILLALAVEAESPVATLGTIWRVAVLSWDNPETQLIQDAATLAVPAAARILREATEHALYAVREAGAAVVPHEERAATRDPVARRFTRAPPSRRH
jgi:hypothetical protein